MNEPKKMGHIKLYNADCMEVMRTFANNEFDIAIVDPPYFDGPNKSGYFGKGFSSLGIERTSYLHAIDQWSIPDAAYFDELRRVSQHQIIWGANHFAGVFDSSSSNWIVWDKMNGESSFADAELAYCSMPGAVRIFRYLWSGMHQGKMGGSHKKREIRINPTQKPIALYAWLLENYAKKCVGINVLDTHLGSGSSAIAAADAGFLFTGIDLDKNQYDGACARVEAHLKQLKLEFS